MMAILIASPCEERGQALAGRIAELIRKNISGPGCAGNPAKSPGFERAALIGPAKAPIGKINDIYRFIIYCKSAEYEQLTEIKDKVEAYMESVDTREENVQFDFDPMNHF